MSKPTIPDDVQTLSDTMMSKLAEIDRDDSLDTIWMGLQVSIISAFFEHLGNVKLNRKYWISAGTLNWPAKARDAKLRNSPNYHNFRLEATRLVKPDRRPCQREIADCMETATIVGDFGDFFRLSFLFGKGSTSAFCAS